MWNNQTTKLNQIKQFIRWNENSNTRVSITNEKENPARI